jgi:hypothetical protein
MLRNLSIVKVSSHADLQTFWCGDFPKKNPKLFDSHLVLLNGGCY